LTASDKRYIPPPPAKANPPDTVSLFWDNAIGKGSTFTIVDKTALLQSAKFC